MKSNLNKFIGHANICKIKSSFEGIYLELSCLKQNNLIKVKQKKKNKYLPQIEKQTICQWSMRIVLNGTICNFHC